MQKNEITLQGDFDPQNHPPRWFRKKPCRTRAQHCNYLILHKYTLKHTLHLVFFLFYTKKTKSPWNHPGGWFRKKDEITFMQRVPNTVITQYHTNTLSSTCYTWFSSCSMQKKRTSLWYVWVEVYVHTKHKCMCISVLHAHACTQLCIRILVSNDTLQSRIHIYSTISCA